GDAARAPAGDDDVDLPPRTREALAEPALMALVGDRRRVERRAARRRVVAPEPDLPAVRRLGGPQHDGRPRREAHRLSHVRTASSSMSTLATRPTTRSTNLGRIPEPGRLMAIIERSIRVPRGMGRAAMRLRR